MIAMGITMRQATWTINSTGREQLEDILYWHFGFSWDGTSIYAPPQPITGLAKPWMDIQKTLTDIESPVHERQQPATLSLFSTLCSIRQFLQLCGTLMMLTYSLFAGISI